MPRLKDHFHSIPNGFQYRQSQTGWELTSWDFMSLCRELQKHRQANPQFKLTTNMGAIIEELDRVNAFRMLTIPGAEIYITETGGPTAGNLKARQRPLSLSAAVSKVGQLLDGKRLIDEWMESGGSLVPQDQSNMRASVCVTCPKNENGDWTKLFTIPASELIRKKLEKLNDHKIHTRYDNNLHLCSACLCPLRLKVHTRIELVKHHLTDEVKEKLWEKCWILSELQSETEPIASDFSGSGHDPESSPRVESD